MQDRMQRLDRSVGRAGATLGRTAAVLAGQPGAGSAAAAPDPRSMSIEEREEFDAKQEVLVAEKQRLHYEGLDQLVRAGTPAAASRALLIRNLEALRGPAGEPSAVAIDGF